MKSIRFACPFFGSYFRHVYHQFLMKWLVWIVGFNRKGAKGSRFNAKIRPAIFHECKNDNYQMKRCDIFFLFSFCLKHRLWAHVRVLTRTHNL